jgi:predicted TIM-barrel fold metal-dependent hydrolase
LRPPITSPCIDTHCHVFDPARFPYAADTAYRPQGQEAGSADTLVHTMDAHGIRHALLVGPNSGYGTDNRCLLDALTRHPTRFKGVAVVRNDAPLDELASLQAAGVLGVAFNVALHGAAHCANIGPLLQRLAGLGLFANVQVQLQQLPEVLPLLQASGVPLVFDHCGRPDVAVGLAQPGFQALLALGRDHREGNERRVRVKLSGFAKFSAQPFPWADTHAYVHALLDAFGPEGCLWATDWPFLRAPERIDLGPLMALAETLMPDDVVRQQVMWHNPRRLLGFHA